MQDAMIARSASGDSAQVGDICSVCGAFDTPPLERLNERAYGGVHACAFCGVAVCGWCSEDTDNYDDGGVQRRCFKTACVVAEAGKADAGAAVNRCDCGYGCADWRARRACKGNATGDNPPIRSAQHIACDGCGKSLSLQQVGLVLTASPAGITAAHMVTSRWSW